MTATEALNAMQAELITEILQAQKTVTITRQGMSDTDIIDALWLVRPRDTLWLVYYQGGIWKTMTTGAVRHNTAFDTAAANAGIHPNTAAWNGDIFKGLTDTCTVSCIVIANAVAVPPPQTGPFSGMTPPGMTQTGMLSVSCATQLYMDAIDIYRSIREPVTRIAISDQISDTGAAQINVGINPRMQTGRDLSYGATLHMADGVPPSLETAYIEGDGRGGTRTAYMRPKPAECVTDMEMETTMLGRHTDDLIRQTADLAASIAGL